MDRHMVLTHLPCPFGTISVTGRFEMTSYMLCIFDRSLRVFTGIRKTPSSQSECVADRHSLISVRVICDAAILLLILLAPTGFAQIVDGVGTQDKSHRIRGESNIGVRIRQQLLDSTVLIVNSRNGSISTGTGVVIKVEEWDEDRMCYWVLTNHHVVDGATLEHEMRHKSHREEGFFNRPHVSNFVTVLPPLYDDNRLRGNREIYLRCIAAKAQEHTPGWGPYSNLYGTVVHSNSRTDLALVRVFDNRADSKRLFPDLWKHTTAVKIAPRVNAAQPGQRIHAVGNAGSSQALWGYVRGTVRNRAAGRATFKDGQEVRTTVLQTDLPINRGDSGSPCVNDIAELVGLNSYVDRKYIHSVSYAIDLSAIYDFLNDTPKLHVVENSLDMPMTLIPDGSFLMGESGDEETFETRQHEVSLKSFIVGVHEVTYTEFESVMGYGRGKSDRKGPATYVNWFEAIEFCNRLSEREGLQPYYKLSTLARRGGRVINASVSVRGGFGYRLPTEAEWEYACRADTTSAFWTGKDKESLQRHIYSGLTTTFGTHFGNPWGLHDMHGSISEWCWDWYGIHYYSQSPAFNPQGPTSGKGRVLRGGRSARSAQRGNGLPNPEDLEYRSIGFRIARTPSLSERAALRNWNAGQSGG